MKNDVRNMFMTYYPHTLFPRRVLNRERVCNRPREHVSCMSKKKTRKKNRKEESLSRYGKATIITGNRSIELMENL